MSSFINFDGKFIPADEPVVQSQNRAFRYGEGIFETMLVKGDCIQLKHYHFARLMGGIKKLDLSFPDHLTKNFSNNLTKQILDLCEKNGHQNLSRVRLQVFRKVERPDVLDSAAGFVIESLSLDPAQIEFKEKGLNIGVYPNGKKAYDDFSHLKSSNYLLYAMAGRYAQKMKLDDCLVLNSQNKICDSSIANVFCVKNETIFTPSLNQGCIAGVMRHYLITSLKLAGIDVVERDIDLSFVADADEIFLTNAIRGLMCVTQFESKTFNNKTGREIFTRILGNPVRNLNI